MNVFEVVKGKWYCPTSHGKATDSTITKLCVMTEEDFAELELYPGFGSETP